MPERKYQLIIACYSDATQTVFHEIQSSTSRHNFVNMQPSENSSLWSDKFPTTKMQRIGIQFAYLLYSNQNKK